MKARLQIKRCSMKSRRRAMGCACSLERGERAGRNEIFFFAFGCIFPHDMVKPFLFRDFVFLILPTVDGSLAWVNSWHLRVYVVWEILFESP